MKLSEAMVLGSTMIKHVSRATDEDDDFQGCALQCAAMAITGSVDYESAFVMGAFPNLWTVSRDTDCPECERVFQTAREVIYHLNDDHCWSIDKIAEWVESIEPKEAEPTTELLTCAEVDVALTAH